MILPQGRNIEHLQAAEKEAKAKKNASLPVGQGKKTEDVFGIVAKKDEDFPTWYQEVVLKAEMIEYYNEVSRGISGAHSQDSD